MTLKGTRLAVTRVLLFRNRPATPSHRKLAPFTMRSISLVLLLLARFSLAISQWNTVGDVDSVSHDANTIRIRSGRSTLIAKILAPDLVRIRFIPRGNFGPDLSWAVVKNTWPATHVAIEETADQITATTDELSVVIGKKPLRITFKNLSGERINEDSPSKRMSWDGTEVRVWKEMPPDEQYYGLGEKAGRISRKFSHTTMWNSDIPGYRATTDPLYQAVPFFYGIKRGKAYGIFFDNTYWSSFDYGKESRDAYSFGAENGEMNYYFFYGPSPRKILARFTDLVGRMPLPPRWSLGYQQCRWSYAPEQRVREIAKGFRSREIPCDVIYLDIDYMDGYRIFTWSPKNFPNPAGMISDLAHDGFKIAVIVDPGIKADTSYSVYRSGLKGDNFVKYPDGRTFIGKVWPGECAFPDFTNAAARQWWGENFSVLVKTGIRGWWNDMNEPSVFDVPTKTIDLDVIHNDNGLMTSHAKNHNVYGMEMTRATYDGVQALSPSERPFVLTRASYAGGQRYSAAWTGDNVATWNHLQMAVSMCLSMSISGQPFVGSDIGGFIGYPSGELFARWLQLGVFTPLMRAHSVINEKNKEPWEFGEEFTNVNRESINLRYRLLPYIYDAMYQASVTGIPPMRPMVFDFPQDGEFAKTDDQFMFGDDMLVAPVLTEGARTRDVRLPAGIWYDFWSGTKYDGAKTISIEASLTRIPILVKSGAIIPTQQVLQYADQSPIDPLTFIVYPNDLRSSSTYYEDDGHTFDYEKGIYFKRTIDQWNSNEAITLTLSASEGTYMPPKRSIIVSFVDCSSSPKSVKLGNATLKKETSEGLLRLGSGWAYQPDSRTVMVRFPESPNPLKVTVIR